MPERGPVQFLLHFLRAHKARGWRIGLAIALVATLGLLPGEESLYLKAKTGLAQSLRQAAWNHALAGEPESKPWPWDLATPAVDTVVTRLGLSAAVHCEAKVEAPETPSNAIDLDAQDPHLASDASPSAAVKVTGREVAAGQADDQLLEPGAPLQPSASPDPCSPLDSSSAFRLMIEAIQARTGHPSEIEQKL